MFKLSASVAKAITSKLTPGAAQQNATRGLGALPVAAGAAAVPAVVTGAQTNPTATTGAALLAAALARSRSTGRAGAKLTGAGLGAGTAGALLGNRAETVK